MFGAENAFDCAMKKLMAHAMKVSVRIKTLKGHIQTFDSFGDAIAPALDSLLYGRELISEKQSGNRISRVNFNSDLPVLRFKHDKAMKRGRHRPLTKTVTPPLPHSGRSVWDTQALSRRRASAMSGL